MESKNELYHFIRNVLTKFEGKEIVIWCDSLESMRGFRFTWGVHKDGAAVLNLWFIKSTDMQQTKLQTFYEDPDNRWGLGYTFDDDGNEVDTVDEWPKVSDIIYKLMKDLIDEYLLMFHSINGYKSFDEFHYSLPGFEYKNMELFGSVKYEVQI